MGQVLLAAGDDYWGGGLVWRRQAGQRGRRGDPVTVAQVAMVKKWFGIAKVVLVGDRDMLTSAQMRDDAGTAPKPRVQISSTG